MFLPGQAPLEDWLVSASGNNAFKADFIRWTPGRKAFKAALKKMCQATCHVVCMHLPRWVGLLGVDGAQAKVSRSVSSTRPVLHFIHHIKSRTPSVTADGEMVRDGIYTYYWMNFKKEKKCQLFKHLNSHFSKFETKF